MSDEIVDAEIAEPAADKPAPAESIAEPVVLIGEADAWSEMTADLPYRERDLIVYVAGKSYAHVADAPDGRWIYSDRHLA